MEEVESGVAGDDISGGTAFYYFSGIALNDLSYLKLMWTLTVDQAFRNPRSQHLRIRNLFPVQMVRLLVRHRFMDASLHGCLTRIYLQ